LKVIIIYPELHKQLLLTTEQEQHLHIQQALQILHL